MAPVGLEKLAMVERVILVGPGQTPDCLPGWRQMRLIG
jgi:hypothetical protein